MHSTIFRYLLSFGFLLLTGCTVTQNKPIQPLIVDVWSGMKNEKELFLSDIADSISYVKLETRPECLLAFGHPLIRHNRIFYSTGRPSRFYVFDINGTFLYQIDHQGKGPGEYLGIGTWTLNESGSRIAFTDGPGEHTYLFSAAGEYINSAKSGTWSISGLAFTSNDRLLLCTSQIIRPIPDFPAVLLYSEDLTQKDTLITRDWSSVVQVQTDYSSIHFSFFGYRNSWTFKELTCDTLFLIDQNFKVYPRLILNTAGKGPDVNQAFSADRSQNIDLFRFYETRDYLFMHLAYQNEYYPLIYNKISRELFTLPERDDAKRSAKRMIDPFNDLDGLNSTFNKDDAGNNIWIDYLDIVDLQFLNDASGDLAEQVRKSKYGQKLIDLFEKSNIDDNPIIRILYLKN